MQTSRGRAHVWSLDHAINIIIIVKDGHDDDDVNDDNDDGHDGHDDDACHDDDVGVEGGPAKVISFSSRTKSGKPAPSYHRPHNHNNQPMS